MRAFAPSIRFVHKEDFFYTLSVRDSDADSRDSSRSTRTTLGSDDKDYHGGLIGLRSGCVRIGAHIRLRIEDYTEYPKVGRLRAPGKREGAKKRVGGVA